MTPQQRRIMEVWTARRIAFASCRQIFGDIFQAKPVYH